MKNNWRHKVKASSYPAGATFEASSPKHKPLPPTPPRSASAQRRLKGYELIPAPPLLKYGAWLAQDGVLELVLPLPPSKNSITAAMAMGGRARVYETKVSKDYKALVAELLRGLPLITKEQTLHIEWIVFHARAGADLLNRVQTGLDALQGVVFENDAQIVECGPSRLEVADWPRWHLFLRRSKLDKYGRLRESEPELFP